MTRSSMSNVLGAFGVLFVVAAGGVAYATCPEAALFCSSSGPIISASNTGTGRGIYAYSASSSSAAIYATNNGYSSIESRTTGSSLSGVYGGYNGSNFGYGIYGEGGGTGIAIMGSVGNGTAYAGYFQGSVAITTNLTVTGVKSFKIDHPLDPENKYLYHSSVESPDMKNVYDGLVTLDANGTAVVVLPDYFQALNRDYRYQLTPIGASASLYVVEEIKNNSFSIAGGKPSLRVSWQVTGIRNDAIAKLRPMQVEVYKSAANKGRYLAPEAFGASPDGGTVLPELGQ